MSLLECGVSQWPPGFVGDDHPPVALHSIVGLEQPDALAHVAEGDVVLIQLPPVTSLDALKAMSLGGLASAVKPEATTTPAPTVVGEDNDTVSHTPVHPHVSILHSIPPDTECKVWPGDHGDVPVV